MPNKQIKKTRINLLDRELAEKLSKEVFLKMEQNPGMTLKEATGVSDRALEEIYSLAYTFYEQGRYKESIALFEFLAGASPSCFKYVLGLAASYHQIQAYNEAAAGFFLALNIDSNNPLPAYYVTDCFLKQNLHEEAQEFAEITSLICDNRPEYAGLKQRCDLIAASLKDKK